MSREKDLERFLKKMKVSRRGSDEDFDGCGLGVEPLFNWGALIETFRRLQHYIRLSVTFYYVKLK